MPHPNPDPMPECCPNGPCRMGVVVRSRPPDHTHQETGLPQVYVTKRTFADAEGVTGIAEPELIIQLVSCMQHK